MHVAEPTGDARSEDSRDHVAMRSLNESLERSTSASSLLLATVCSQLLSVRPPLGLFIRVAALHGVSPLRADENDGAAGLEPMRRAEEAGEQGDP